MAKLVINTQNDPRKHAAALSRRADSITARQKAILEESEENGNVFSADSRKEFDELEAEYKACEAGIVSLGGKKVEAGWVMPRLSGANSGQALELDDDAPADTRQHSTTGGPRCADLFGPLGKTANAGYDQPAEFLQDIARNNHDRLAAVSGGSLGIPSDGGFLVPEQFMYSMLDAAMESEVVRPRATVLPMTLPYLNYSSPDDSDHSGDSTYGGLKGQWVAEGGSIATKVMKLRRMRLEARKLVIMSASTNEMLADVPTFGSMLEGAMQADIAWDLDRTFLIDGTGAGQPRSVLNDPALITISKETGQGAATLQWENVVKMAARLHPSCAAKAVWVANQTCMPALMSMSVAVGTGGTWVPAITQIGGAYQLLGRPIVFTEKCNTIGTLGDIMLVDFSKYHVGIMANGMRIDRSMHVNFSTDETVFRVIIRADGQGTWKQAFVPKHGDSLSWCVALATRA